jgi:phenylalanyl-tRNA synthetase beta chain
MFKRLGFAVSATADGWAVTAHSARFDIEIEADLVEEIARIFGYDNLPVVPANDFVPLGQATEHSVDSARIADLLVDRGYREIITYSFIDEASDRDYATGGAGLALTNPISSDLSVMRQSLWPGLVSTYMSNAARQRSRMQIFECGALFDNSRGEVLERQVLSGLAAGTSLPEQWGTQESAVDYFDIKSDLEAIFDLTGQRAEFSFNSGEHPALHPGRTARITRNDAAVGWLGEIHPALARRVGVEVPLVLFELELNPLISAALPHFSDVSRYPAVRRDLALVVRKEVPAGDLLAEARSAAGSALQDIVVFDVYMGKNIDSGLKSVALGLILQETSRTLTDTDAEEIIRAVAEHLAEKFGAKIRE